MVRRYPVSPELLALATPPADPQTLPDETPMSEATAEAVETRRKVELACDEILTNVASGHIATAAERLLLRSICPDAHNTQAFERWLRGEVARIKSIRQLQASSGTPSDRAKAVVTADLARQRQANDTPVLLEKIAQLGAEIKALADATQSAETDVANRTRAVELLQETRRLPAFIRESLQVIRKTTEGERAEFLKAEARLQSIEGLCRLDPANKEDMASLTAYANSCPTTGDGRLSDMVFKREPYRRGDVSIPEFQPSAWQAHLESLRAEAVEHRQTIARLEIVMQRIAAENSALRTYWIPK